MVIIRLFGGGGGGGVVVKLVCIWDIELDLEA